MYIISDIVEVGNAHEHILSLIKEPPIIDDSEPHSISPEEAFDE